MLLMQVACCQLDIIWEDKLANYRKVRSLVAKAHLPAGTLLVLPEMFATGFNMNAAALAEAEGGPTSTFLQELASEFRLCVVAGLATVDQEGRARNQALAFSPEGELLARYTKMQPFGLGGETGVYGAGDKVVTFNWCGCLVAPFVCYDLRFPELFRLAVGVGARLFLVIANWPLKRDGHWAILLQARAIENQACVVGVNRCGVDPNFTYSGRSMIVDHYGQVLTELVGKEGIVTAELDLQALEEWRRNFPALQDMKPNRS